MSPALVTGGNGYLGTHLIAALLRAGSPVRTTVRSAASEESLRTAGAPRRRGHRGQRRRLRPGGRRRRPDRLPMTAGRRP